MAKQTRSLGRAIREQRLQLGLTQEELAERIGAGVRQADISRLERDRIRLPRAPRLRAIAQALGIEPGELLVRSGWDGALGEYDVDPVTPIDREASASPAPASAPRLAPVRQQSGDDAELYSRLRQVLDESVLVRAQAVETIRRAEAVARVWNRQYGVDTPPSSEPSSH